ncbi:MULTISPECIES: cyclopropane-fatty-acyl-phospholipid synthase family protein [unclassified Thioalkalivibrio]|uniref:SAM-dependent methyltransferase n=1 Tax=unclassified Thioalkalivibrio TaxID=2621013 RepID=UPI00037C19C6|nr:MULTISPECIES: cyclopropane-fatty-acyl-phospholipid synthase family protein [unclassified Thioalkalivibrio]
MIERMLNEYMRHGTLILREPDGSERRFGQGAPEITLQVHDRAALKRIARDPGFQLGETYMDGLWSPGPEGIRVFLDVAMRNFAPRFQRRVHPLVCMFRAILEQGNRIARSYQNISHHYDVDEWLFRRFLDEGMFYSCAYFERPDMTLEEAQQAKCAMLRKKLVLEPGQRVLDIGCGWGGLAFHLAENADVQVDGITLSREQLRVAQAEAKRRGLDDRVRFFYQDYREHDDQYDRVVSVGMFEHVGVPNYGTFFQRVNDLLKDDGVAVLHTIGRQGPPGTTNPWLSKYIFPGGYTPALSEVMEALEPTPLHTTDIEFWRLHYAETLAEWYRRFQNIRAEAVEHFDERFCRMWEFYLASCEATFRWWRQVVFHIQVAKQQDAVPLTRDYLYADEVPEVVSTPPGEAAAQGRSAA